MSKEVILMEDVDGLGLTGDLVKVADGYARNYLLPRNIAAPVTEATRRRVEKRRAAAEAKRAQQRAGAEELARKLAAFALSIPVKTGSEGRMFGSVTAHDIAAALQREGFVVEKQKIALHTPLKELGEATVVIRLMADVHADLKVTLVAE
ncbi:MAG: 50S ribosomal protein L9 [Kiritimatiellae bacterium]|nr:50S ribosomal protein L9 [Kiritimatiellia bacterium]MCO5061813.1 50S ribosomal protein L9 [Kiritimatiellia bacterium]MCO6400429.1 50S ribosomal protein L9 [Verrucomicrobiota bacterium]